MSMSGPPEELAVAMTDNSQEPGVTRTSAEHLRLLSGQRSDPLAGIRDLMDDLGSAHLNEIELRFEQDDGILWAYQRHLSRPSFTLSLLRDVNRFQELMRSHGAKVAPDAGSPLRYLIWASRTPGIFNLGGDLPLFVRLIRNRDRAGLERYAKACIDICYSNAVNMDLPVCTVALAQGDTLGGGFESALSNDLLVAEKSAKFGLPEIIYGLLPGMGAYSFLARRIGPPAAEKLIKSGNIYTADEMYERGIVDLVVEDGAGEEGVREMTRKLASRHPAHVGLYRMRRRFEGVTYDELMDIALVWVDTALQLRPADLRNMERLANLQARRHERSRRANQDQDQDTEREVVSRPSA
jgi:DSF synthase